MLKTRSIAEASLLTGLSVAFYLAARFLPLVGFIIVFMSPIPLVILEMRHDLRTGAIALIVGMLLVMLLSGPLSGVSYALGFGVLALALGRIIELKRSAVEIVVWGSLVSLFCKVMLAVMMFYVTGLNPFTLDLAGMDQAMDWFLSFNGSNSEATRAQLEAVMSILPMMVPTIVIIASVGDSFFCYWLSAKVIRRVEHIDLPELPPFSEWHFPVSIIGAYVASIVFSILGSKYPQYGVLIRVGLNVNMIVSYIFMLQGFSLAAWFLDRRGVNKRLRSVLLVVAFFMPILGQLALYAGIFDMCWNIRRRAERR